MELVIITGMSGAGKTSVLEIFEDIDYYCVDNLPPSLIKEFVDLAKLTKDMKKLAISIDSRGGRLFEDLLPAMEDLDKKDIKYTVLFLEASDEELIRRFTETRRNHPLAKGKRLIKGLTSEREKLRDIRNKADMIIDTTDLLERQLKNQIVETFVNGEEYSPLNVTLLSFGFKNGLPNDADIVMDVRFIPNPYYIKELRPQSGNDQAVQDYVMKQTVVPPFLEKLEDMIDFLIPNYIEEGKSRLLIAVGCTGGQHRSVTVINHLYEYLTRESNGVVVVHRDIKE